MNQSVLGDGTTEDMSHNFNEKKVVDPEAFKMTTEQYILKLFGNKEPKRRKHQMVGFDAIRMISKMLHMQKKSLGLKLSGDQIISHVFDRSQMDKIISLRR